MNKQCKAPAQTAREHTQKYVTEAVRKGNDAMRRSEKAKIHNAQSC